MPVFLSLSRAARLVGVSRGAIQNKIKKGVLPTFEGMIDPADLLQVYPSVDLNKNTELDRVNKIKEQAFAKRVRERILPDANVLTERLNHLGKELALAKAKAMQYESSIEAHLEKLNALVLNSNPLSDELKPIIDSFHEDINRLLTDSGATHDLLVKDSFLRVMFAQVKIIPTGHEFFVEGNDSLLDAALKAGFAMDYGCSDGSCGRCKAKLVSGTVSGIREQQFVLSESEVEAGTVLMCTNTAVGDLEIQALEAQSLQEIQKQEIKAKVLSKRLPNKDMMILQVQTPRSHRLRYFSGQEVEVILNQNVARVLPIASCPCDDRNLFFHIPRNINDRFSHQVFDSLKPSDPVLLKGPFGRFILDDNSTKSLIFVAQDEGMAPIKSLIEHAMALAVAERIELYWVRSDDKSHYLGNLCRSWTDALENFNANLLTEDRNFTDALQCIIQDHADILDFDVYVAGTQPFMQDVEKLLLNNGLPSSQIKTNTLSK